jgi:hypothetical protein
MHTLDKQNLDLIIAKDFENNLGNSIEPFTTLQK